ncbi:MAG: SAM-dependent methyltransferase [Chitinophagaceae bacterium]
MADKKDLDFTYSTMDKIFRLSIGEKADFSGAMYNGDFSISLEEAQRRKHRFIADQLKITKGSRILDLGCGWGPFLNFSKSISAEAVGVTLSEAQHAACIKNGFDVYMKDARTIKPSDFGKFDVIVSVGAFEHFCSLEEYKQGKQEEIYSHFFKTVADLLPAGGRFYLQTMVYGKNRVEPEELESADNDNSDAYFLGLMTKHFLGSWLPYGSEMILKNADPYFKVIFISSGRLDYIETTNQWRKRIRSFNIKKYILFLKLLPKIFTSSEFRHKLNVFKKRANKVCFEREIMDHYRIVLEKRIINT